MSTVSEIVAVLGELNLLTQRAPAALARREEILATKRELVERIRAEDEPGAAAPTPAPTTCARSGCENLLIRKPKGRPARYCSSACRPSAPPSRRRGVVVEVEHPDTSPDGRPVGRVWTVTLRRGARAVVIAADLGWPSAHALARQLEELLRPVPRRGGAVE